MPIYIEGKILDAFQNKKTANLTRYGHDRTCKCVAPFQMQKSHIEVKNKCQAITFMIN